MDKLRIPIWLDDSRLCYSLIEPARVQLVSFFDVTDCDEVGGDSPGVLRLRLEPRFRYSPSERVLNADGREEGIIQSEGLFPGARHTMRRHGGLIWMLSVRSIVRRRHALTLTNGETWLFHTPFFSNRLIGEIRGHRKLVGDVGPDVSVWRMAIERGKDTVGLLSAAAFLHRQWVHS